MPSRLQKLTGEVGLWFDKNVKRFFLVFSTLILVLLSVGTVGAVSDEVSNNVVQNWVNVGQEIKETKNELRQTLTEIREEHQAQMQEVREAVREAIQAKKEEFKEKLALLKDERKRLIVERLEQRMAAINENRTDHFSKVLARLEEVLVKIEILIGSSPSAEVSQALAEAKEALARARAAVNTQAAKEYIFDVSDEEAIHQEAAAAFGALRTDLTDTKVEVQAAKFAVMALWAKVKVAQGVNSNVGQ